MKKCAYCGRENSDNASNCSECGSPNLRAADDPEAIAQAEGRQQTPVGWLLENTRILSPAEMQLDFVTLTQCRTLPEADVIVSELESAGIEAFIPDECLMQNFSLPGMFGYVRVQVAPKDYAAAREFLMAQVAEPPAEAPIPEPPLKS